MSKGPEANFWNQIRSNLPPKTHATRIENKHGGGVPDVHLVWDGISFWLELKVIKGNAINISPHQIAWHMAYFTRGGQSFFLAKRSLTRELLLFAGDQGPNLASGGVSGAVGHVFAGPAPLFCALRPLLLNGLPCALRPDP